MDHTFQIAELLHKRIKGELSSKEEEALQQWIKQDEGNSALYHKMMEDHTLIDKLDDYELFDTAKAWATLDHSLFETKIIGLKLRSVMRYAAVLLPLIVLMSIGYYWWNQEFNTLSKIDEVFTPWESKATLILADGQAVILDKDSLTRLMEAGIQLSDQNDAIAYAHQEEVEEFEPLTYNSLLTPKGGKYRLTLSDGTEVWLNANSSIKYPVRFTDSTREVFLKGEAFFDVEHNGKPFIVNTAETDIRVLGTSFNVFAYQNEPYTATTLVEGSIKLSTGNAEKILVPMEQASVYKKQSEILVETVNTEIYTSWVDGKIEFEEERLEAVMRRLARLYDFEFEFEENELKDFHFTARIDNTQPISNILSMLEMTTDVNFKLKNNTIIIH